MGEQHSQKQGLKSSAQKEDRARDAYAETSGQQQSGRSVREESTQPAFG